MQNGLETAPGHQLSEDDTFLSSGANESPEELCYTGTLQLAGRGGREGRREGERGREVSVCDQQTL